MQQYANAWPLSAYICLYACNIVSCDQMSHNNLIEIHKEFDHLAITRMQVCTLKYVNDRILEQA